MPTVQLFITCLGEQFYSATLQNLVRLLERLGVAPSFPEGQTCCGQPLYNNGFELRARQAARSLLRAFAASPHPLVAPSGSCVAMIRKGYPALFPPGAPEHEQAIDLAGRTYELTEYLVRVLGVCDVGAVYPHRVAYHASCHPLRELGLRQEARLLLSAVRGLELLPLTEEDTCCGFGGAFSVTFPEISQAMLRDKLKNIQASGAEQVVVTEPGCLMNIAGGLQRAGSSLRAVHIIDVLAAQETAP
ncbi:MAG: (Fe-S)-binding protein [Chloroflexota bacterium]